MIREDTLRCAQRDTAPAMASIRRREFKRGRFCDERLVSGISVPAAGAKSHFFLSSKRAGCQTPLMTPPGNPPPESRKTSAALTRATLPFSPQRDFTTI
jgi:hypothetical protein